MKVVAEPIGEALAPLRDGPQPRQVRLDGDIGLEGQDAGFVFVAGPQALEYLGATTSERTERLVDGPTQIPHLASLNEPHPLHLIVSQGVM